MYYISYYIEATGSREPADNRPAALRRACCNLLVFGVKALYFASPWLLVWLSCLWNRWRPALVIVKPACQEGAAPRRADALHIARNDRRAMAICSMHEVREPLQIALPVRATSPSTEERSARYAAVGDCEARLIRDQSLHSTPLRESVSHLAVRNVSRRCP
jgi:hypothetical protein